MKGLQLSRLTDELHEVAQAYDSVPSRSLRDIDAKLGEKTVANYREALAREKNLLGMYLSLYAQPRSSYADQVRQNIAELEEKIAHIEGDRSRIIALYDDIGRFKRGRACVDANKLSHRSVRFPKAEANAA